MTVESDADLVELAKQAHDQRRRVAVDVFRLSAISSSPDVADAISKRPQPTGEARWYLLTIEGASQRIDRRNAKAIVDRLGDKAYVGPPLYRP